MDYTIDYYLLYVKVERSNSKNKSKDTYKIVLTELPKTEEDFIQIINTEMAGYFEVYKEYYDAIKIVGYKVETYYKEVKLDTPIEK